MNCCHNFREKSICCEPSKQMGIKNLKQKIVIFGAGNAGIAALKNLRGEYQPIAFCDNDLTKAGTELAGLRVISPEQLASLEFDLVMIASEYFEQIKFQLENELRIPWDKINILSASQIKPFHFGDSDSAIQKAEQILFSLCDVLRSCGIKYHVDAGTLLGIYRDDALIPWDDDLDIAVPSDYVSTIRANKQRILDRLHSVSEISWQCIELFASRDFGLVKKGATRSFKLAPIDVNENFPLIDFFVKYLDENTMDYVISSRGFSMPSEHMRDLEMHMFKSKQISIPSNAAGYLEHHYGDWQTPNPNWTLEQIQSATVFAKNN
jgi:hypothetical protein